MFPPLRPPIPDDCVQYAYPVATAVPSGDGDDDAPLAGWADLEPQTLPPYAPTALWRQEEAPTGYDGEASRVVLSDRPGVQLRGSCVSLLTQV